MILPIAVWATDRADAEAKARAWADAEPNVESASILSAEPRDGRTFPDTEVVWHVTLALTMRTAEMLSLWA